MLGKRKEDHMPRMDSPESEAQGDANTLVKLLLIGDGKLGKSHYAAMAAACGLNVLYLDGDVALPTIRKLPLEVRSRIYHMDIRDTILGGQRDSRMWEVMKEFTSTVEFRWNDSQGRPAKRADVGAEIWAIKPGRMDHTSVLVLDSWTSFTESVTLAAAIDNNVDLAEASTSQMRPVYQMAGLKGTQMLQMIRSMRCHVIVLAHPDEYSHTTKPEGRKVKDIKEPDLIIDWTRMIPKSTSKPHGMQMAKYFTDVAWMATNPSGSERLLDFRMKDDRVSGGHFNGRENTDKYSFANLISEVGGRLPNKSEPAGVGHWLKIISPDDSAAQVEVQAAAETPVLDGRAASPMKGMAGFIKKAV